MIAAITAGGRVVGPLAAAIGTDIKALAPLGSGALIDRSIEAAAGAGAREIVVIGGAAVRSHCAPRVDRVVPENPDGRDNLRLAIECARGEPLLLMTSDLPFLSAEPVRAFLAEATTYDVALPLASSEAYRAAFPGAPVHETAIGRDRIVSGCVVFFAAAAGPRTLEVSQRLFAARKSLWRMAALLGPALLVRFAFGRLEIAQVERRAHALLGIDARAVRDVSPALCYDVDSIEDYRYATAFDAQR